MRLESVILHIGVALVLCCLFLLCGKYCCCDADIAGVCDLATIGGLSSFAEISFALDTSIAIEWVLRQFVVYFDRFAERKVFAYQAQHSAKVSDSSADDIAAQIAMLKGRFCDMMLWPARIYKILGLVFAIGIAVLLFRGIPVCFRPYVILLPFPAIAYYLTAIATGLLAAVHLDSFFHDKDLPAPDEKSLAGKDIEALVRDAGMNKKSGRRESAPATTGANKPRRKRVGKARK